ncbi:CapA family protein [Providencia stuartii]|uniref:CapA family protein n=1 Tax=Providencia stuartii TaxID=588 RepID=UPI0033183DB1
MNLCFLGDFYLTKEKKYSSDFLDILRKSERIFINFEAPIKTPNAVFVQKVGATLAQDEKVINELKALGITDLCLANNHYFDLGYSGAINSTLLLRENGFITHGINSKNENSSINIINDKIAIINVCESEFGVSDIIGEKYGLMSVSDPLIYVKIAELKKQYPHILLIVHAGKENTLTPLPQWKTIYRAFIKLGVSAVIAHHPHVPQYIEEYNDGFIFYSLGNFIMDYISNHRLSSIGLLINLDFSSEKIKLTKKYIHHNKSKNEICLCNQTQSELLDHLLKINFDKDISVDMSVYDNMYLKRSIMQYLPNFIYKIKYFRNRRNKVYDFLIHNIRFESHRY